MDAADAAAALKDFVQDAKAIDNNTIRVKIDGKDIKALQNSIDKIKNKDIRLQLTYDLNKAAFKNLQNKMQDMEAYLDTDKAREELEALGKKMRDIFAEQDKLSFDDPRMDQLDDEMDRAQRRAEELVSIMSKLKGENIIPSLSKETQEIFGDLSLFPDKGKKLKYTQAQLDAVKKEAQAIVKIMNGLLSKGAVDFELQSKGISQLSGIDPFTVGMEADTSKFTSQVKDAVDSIPDKKTIEVDAEVPAGNLTFRVGDMQTSMKKSEGFHRMISSMLAGGIKDGEEGFGMLGTGHYFSDEYDDLSIEGKNPYGYVLDIDPKKYNLFEPQSQEHATQALAFLSKLQQYAIKLGTNHDMFKDLIPDVNIDSLFSDMSKVFPDAKVTKEKFSGFVDDMISLVKSAGEIDEYGNFKDLPKELDHADNIGTRFMKMLGYGGVDFRNTQYGGYDHGSVVYDLDPNDIKKVLKNNEELDKVGKEITNLKLTKSSNIKLPEKTPKVVRQTDESEVGKSTSDSSSNINDESEAFNKLAGAAEAAANAKSKFIESNMSVGQTAEASVASLQNESDAFAKIGESASESISSISNLHDTLQKTFGSSKKDLEWTDPITGELFNKSDLASLYDSLAISESTYGLLTEPNTLAAAINTSASKYLKPISVDDIVDGDSASNIRKERKNKLMSLMKLIGAHGNAAIAPKITDDTWFALLHATGLSEREIKNKYFHSSDKHDETKKQLKTEIDNYKSGILALGGSVDGVLGDSNNPYNINITTNADTVDTQIQNIRNTLDKIPDKKDIKINVIDYSNIENLSDESGKEMTFYHGTNGKMVGMFNSRGQHWGTDNPDVAATYVNKGFWGDDVGKIYETKYRFKNPLEIDANGSYFSEVEYENPHIPELSGKRPTFEWADLAEKYGFDGVIFKNIIDTFNGDDLKSTVAMPLHGAQVVGQRVVRRYENGELVEDKIGEPHTSSHYDSQNYDNVSSALDSIVPSANAAASALQSLASSANANVLHGDNANISNKTVIDNKGDTAVDQSSVDSSASIEKESQSLSELATSAQKAAEYKQAFVAANKELEASTEKSIGGISAESSKLDELHSSISKMKGDDLSGENFKEGNAEEIAKANKEASQASEETASDLEKESSAITELNSNIEKLTGTIDSFASSGKDAMSQLSNSITESSGKIQSLLSDVKDISQSFENLASAGKTVGDSTSQSVDNIGKEKEVFDELSQSAEKASAAKDGFASSNQKVSSSAKESSDSVDKEVSAITGAKAAFKKASEVTHELNSAVLSNLPKFTANSKEKTSGNVTGSGFNYERAMRLWSELDLSELDEAKSMSLLGKIRVSTESAAKNMIDTIDAIFSDKNNTQFTDSFAKKLQSTRDSLDTVSEQSISDRLDMLGEAQSVLFDANSEKLADKNSISKFTSKVQRYLQKNSSMDEVTTSRFRGMIAAAQDSQTSVRGLKELENAYNGLTESVGRAGISGKSFWDTFTDRIKNGSAQFLAQYFSIQDFIRYAQQAVQAINDIDSALIELRKVSNASDFQIDDALQVSEKTAQELGATVSDTVSATADWARLGYNLPDSEQLGRVATLYKNVGDGIDITQANESLISTLQGFQMEASDSMEIVDKFNEVANNFPIDSGGIGEALQRSAASFNAAHTDLSKSIALVTTTNAVVQDPDVVGSHMCRLKKQLYRLTA